MSKDFYRLSVAGLERDLPLCPISDKLKIGAFVIFGDTELTCACARELVAMAPEHDVLITAESKGIPLIHEMARQAGEKRYVLARKSVKLYMKDVRRVDVTSITTANTQTLYVDGADADYMKGKRVLIVDDVISTGESLRRRNRRTHGHSGRGRRHRPQRHQISRAAAAVRQRGQPAFKLIISAGSGLDLRHGTLGRAFFPIAGIWTASAARKTARFEKNQRHSCRLPHIFYRR